MPADYGGATTAARLPAWGQLPTGHARRRTVAVVLDDAPRDPFAGDPSDPAAELARLDPDDEEPPVPLDADEREGVLDDLGDVEVFAALLGPRGVDGLVVDCGDCEQEHYFGWELLRSNLRHLLDTGAPRVHEPAFHPDPLRYVSWDYARGWADATEAADASLGDID